MFFKRVLEQDIGIEEILLGRYRQEKEKRLLLLRSLLVVEEKATVI